MSGCAHGFGVVMFFPFAASRNLLGFFVCGVGLSFG
jgi:hypothetical protein